MAGIGKKTFVDGDVLSAAQVNGYLMDQAVMRFASATARDAAITSPSEGMVCYLDDVNWLMVYTGSSWTITGGDKPIFYVNGSQSVTNNTSTVANFTGNVVTNRGSFTLSGSPAVVLVPQTGVYSITSYAQFPANATGIRNVQIDINGNHTPETIIMTNSATYNTTLNNAFTVYMTAGSYCAIRLFQTTGGTQTVTYRFSMAYLGA